MTATPETPSETLRNLVTAADFDSSAAFREWLATALRAQATRVEPRFEHDSLAAGVMLDAATFVESLDSTLDGATQPREPESGRYPRHGEFAAEWNAWTEERRAKWLTRIAAAFERATTCLIQDHPGELESLRRLHEAATDRTVALAAVIEQAKATTPGYAIDGPVRRILEAADTDAALAEHDERIRRTVLAGLVESAKRGEWNKPTDLEGELFA